MSFAAVFAVLLVVALAVAVFYVVAISSGHVTLKRQKLNDIAEATELHMSGRGQMPRFLERLARWERLQALPTRYLTGHYVAVLAQKP